MIESPLKHRYREVARYIKSNIDDIRRHALTIVERDYLREELREGAETYRNSYPNQFLYPDEENWEIVDTWDSYGELVDLHIVNEGASRLKCWAYPVLNDTPCYDSDIAIEISLEETK